MFRTSFGLSSKVYMDAVRHELEAWKLKMANIKQLEVRSNFQFELHQGWAIL